MNALVLTLLVAAAPAASPARERVEALVHRCVAAYGGKEALARAAVTQQDGRVTSLLHAGQAGRIARAYVRPGKLRVEISWPDGTGEVRVLDGGRGWRDGEEVAGARLVAMILQAARLDVPALLSAWVANVEDRGEGQVDGKPVRILALAPAPGLLLVAEVELATGRVLRSRGTSIDPGMPLAFETTYGDFRRVEGSSCRSSSATGRTAGPPARRCSRR